MKIIKGFILSAQGHALICDDDDKNIDDVKKDKINKEKTMPNMTKKTTGKVTVSAALMMADSFDPSKPMPLYALALRSLAGRVRSLREANKKQKEC